MAMKVYMKPRSFPQKYLTVHRLEPKQNFLKYIRVIRVWAKQMHGLHLFDLEILAFLYSEGIFDLNKFDSYAVTFGFMRKSLPDLMARGWITYFRKPDPKHKKKAQYELSAKAKMVLANVYRKLNMEEPIRDFISEYAYKKKKAPYTHRMLQRGIKIVNNDIKEQQRRHVLKQLSSRGY